MVNYNTGIAGMEILGDMAGAAEEHGGVQGIRQRRVPGKAGDCRLQGIPDTVPEQLFPLARVHERCFRSGYTGFLPGETASAPRPGFFYGLGEVAASAKRA